MNSREHNKYLKEFKAYTRDVISSKESAQEFLIRSGINTKTGKLSKRYTEPKSK